MHPLEKTTAPSSAPALEALGPIPRAALAPMFGLVRAICTQGAAGIEAQLASLKVTPGQANALRKLVESLREIDRQITRLTS